MDCVKQYDSLPLDAQLLVEEYTVNLEFAEDCFDTLLSLVPKKEGSIRALAESYAFWKHNYLTALDQLKQQGLTDTQINMVRMGYYTKHKE